VETVGFAIAFSKCDTVSIGDPGMLYCGLQLLAARPSGADIAAFQFGNYAKFFEDFFYPKILLSTIRVSFETVIICVVMGYIPAYYFYRSKSRFKQVYSACSSCCPSGSALSSAP
jgi:ABC-type spermidine/putrescine transport system permease subunit I